MSDPETPGEVQALWHQHWQHSFLDRMSDTSDPRYFGTETLRTQCGSVQKTLRHWVRSVRSLSSQDTSDLESGHFGTRLRMFGL